MRRKSLTGSVFVLIMALSSSANIAGAAVAVPPLLQYQARLSTTEGINVDGDVVVRVLIYDSADSGMPGDIGDPHVLYAEDHGRIMVDRGTLRFAIGEGQALGQFAGMLLPLAKLAAAPGVYIELHIDGERIAPRQRVAFHNAALQARYARTADEIDGEMAFNESNLPDGFSANLIDRDTMNAARITNVPSSKLSGPVHVNRLPNNIPLSKIGGGTLSPAVLPPISANTIVAGSPPSTFSTGMLPATLLREGSLGFGGGVLNHGDTVPPPAGFALAECAWIASYRNDDEALYLDDAINDIMVYPGSAADPTITCELIKNASAKRQCSVNYLIICKH